MLNKIDYDNVSELDIHDIEYLICHVGMLWRRLINERIKKLGISGLEKRVLFSIARYPGSTQVHIAGLLELEPQNLIRVLDRLVEQGLIERCTNPKDRRVRCLYITSQAKKMIAEINKISREVKPQILSGVDQKKIETVVRHLSNIRENLFGELALVSGKIP